ncbi:MAG: thioredoxin domain-containing protein [Proteobacteria bacterium]|nr:thioredoxin domain-containing protein [Pseudomonadota bacterium]MBU1057946.1 thioredoxin domain-containing protein [Pseudomonadota bacterium]
MLEHNPETVKIVLKNLPLNFHKFAQPAALAALAAGNQGKYWEFHDALFEAPKLDATTIDTIATKLGLDIKVLKEDMASAQIQQKLAKDVFDAQEAGVRGTPTIIINGRLLKERSLAAIQKVIDEELAKK